MSTRCATYFTYADDEPEAIVYRHTDGYPEGHGLDLSRFFADVEAQTEDTRYGDPTYLAAKLVVWLAARFSSGARLDFLSVGVVTRAPDDVAYLYVVDCGSERDERGRPLVRCHEAEGTPTGDVALGREVPIPAEVPA